MPPKALTYRALYCFTIDEPDELELLPGDLIDVDVVQEGEWGFGTSRRTQKSGQFPWTYVELCKTPSNPHALVQTSSKKPAYCQHCNDFIWGALGKQSYRCSACDFRCHKKCKFFVENNSALECTPPPGGAAALEPDSETIETWTVEDVCIWLAAIKMQEYIPNFQERGIDGKKLQSLSPSKIGDLGIEDAAHKEMMLACLTELLRGDARMSDMDFTIRAQLPTVSLDALSFLDICPRPKVAGDKLLVVRNHPFRLKTFTSMCWCDVCRKPLWGVVRQGLQCTACGYNTHRMCLDTVPQCTPQTLAVNPGPRAGLPGAQTGFAFGLPLESQMNGQSPPAMVLQCIGAVDKALKTANLYRAAPPAPKLRALRQDLASKQVNLAACDVHLVAAILKRFFIELPEPLIPWSAYDKFVAAASLPSEGAQIAELDQLVRSLPDAQRITLTELMQHLGRVTAMSDANKMDPQSLAVIWAPVLLYPTEEMLTLQFRQQAQAVSATALLLSRCDCSGKPALKAPPPIPRKPKTADGGGKGGLSSYENITVAGQALYMSSTEAMRPVPKPRPPKPVGLGAAAAAAAASPAAPSSQSAPLDSYPWFAGTMDRVSAEQAVQDGPDGTFLVRVSQTHNGYSLTVKYREIRHIVIIASGGKYGFSEPTSFDSVADLVRNFERTSLQQYNAELETTLRYPFKTAPKSTGTDDSGYEDAMTEELYIKNVSALRESLEQQARQNQRNVINEYSPHVKEMQRDIKAQEEIVNMFKEQKKLHESYRESLGDQADRVKVQANYELLVTRLAEYERQLAKMNADLQAEKHREDTQRSRGDSMSTSGGVVVSDTAGFFVGATSREEAEKMLDGQADGTFLVRLSSKSPQEPCTLSMRYGGVTKHIHIKYDGLRYGLAEPLSFNSLDSLCEYYKNEKLSGSIATTLTKPIKEARR